jgi:hypothetical protein
MRLSIGLTILLLIPATLHAGFVDMEEGARATAVGGAFVAIADDATAIFWNPAGAVFTDGFKLTGMRTRLYSMDNVSEDCVALSYGGWNRTGLGFGWGRSGVEDIYSENTFVLGAGRRLFSDRFGFGTALRVYRVSAPGYQYYNDPNFKESDTGYAVDVGFLYRSDKWSLGGVVRNMGQPELKLISTSEESDPIYSELRLGGTYTIRDVMLVTGEIRRPRDVPAYYDSKVSYYLGTEIWFFDVFALRTGLHRNAATAGLGLTIDWLTVDAAMMSGRRPGNKYRLSVSLDF